MSQNDSIAQPNVDLPVVTREHPSKGLLPDSGSPIIQPPDFTVDLEAILNQAGKALAAPTDSGPTWDSIPAELKSQNQWVVWRRQERDGKSTKVPFTASGSYAKSNDRTTWTSFNEAQQACIKSLYDGVGFVFTADDSYVGIDLDHCLDDAGEAYPWAKSIIDQLASYSEVSPSGHGVKVFVRGKLPAKCRNKRTGLGSTGNGAVEVYEQSRYFTVTGWHLAGTPTTVEDRTEQIALILRDLFPSPAARTSTVPTSSASSAVPAVQPIDDEILLKRAMASQLFKGLWDGKHEGDHSKADYALCCQLGRLCGPNPERIDRLFRRSGLYRPKWDEKHYSDGSTYGQMTLKRVIPNIEQAVETFEQEEFMTDLRNSETFASEHRDVLRCCPHSNDWLIWDGRRWATDRRLAVYQLAKQTVNGMTKRAEGIQDDKGRDSARRSALSLASRTRINAMIDLSRCELAVLAEQLDANPWLMTVNNGTIDLQTGQLRESRQEDSITRLAPVDYDPNAQCPLWLSVLDTVLGGKQALVDYVQKIFGYALTGIVTEDLLPIFYGEGANGKTTVLNTLMKLMGEYASSAPPQLLVGKRAGRQPFDVADLKGRRLVVASETEDRDQLSEGLVKQLVGHDIIKARCPYGQFFEFEPTHKILLMTNHKPEVRGSDTGIWRRLALVPFTVTIPREKRDPKLEEKLRLEWPGILAWAVRGCLAWQRDGLDQPAEVQEATSQYRQSSNTFLRFVDEMCFRESQTWTPSSVIREAYRRYCEQIGESQPLSDNGIASALKDIGCIYKPRNTGRGWLSIGVHRSVPSEGAQASSAAPVASGSVSGASATTNATVAHGN